MRKTKKATSIYLSKKQMQQLPKPRAGFAKLAPSLIALCRDRADVLYIKDLDIDATLAELDAYKALFEPISDARIAFAKLRHAQFLHASLLWQAMLRIYRHARAVARDDQAMRVAIADFERFMKHKKKTKRRKARLA